MIRFENINLKYGEIEILKNFNLNIDIGQKIILKGKSGKGKSSILKLLMGFIKPQEGKIFFENEELNEKTVWNIRKKISYISQNIEFPQEEKVVDILKEIFSYKANLKKEWEEKINMHIKYFELKEEIMEKKISKISGGERQRLGIITAIILDRPVFLLDEITSALDKELKKKTVDYFLNSEKTLVAVSHDEEWILNKNIKILEI